MTTLCAYLNSSCCRNNMTANGGGALVNTMKGLCGTSCGGLPTFNWDVPGILSTGQRRLTHNYAVVILNRPISQNLTFMKTFWNNATVRVTVDGGTVQWDAFVSKSPKDTKNPFKWPDLVTGDFDSITEEILNKYKKNGCKIIKTPDQDHTDFTKSLMELYKYCKQHMKQVDHVVAIGKNSGRLDQTLGNIQTLFLVREKQLMSAKITLYLMSDDALSWLLIPGQHIITIPPESRKHKRAWCSLVPIAETCETCTTTGLKWNLDHQTLRFGELVSTSNTFSGEETVTVSCSNTLLWTMRVPMVSSIINV